MRPYVIWDHEKAPVVLNAGIKLAIQQPDPTDLFSHEGLYIYGWHCGENGSPSWADVAFYGRVRVFGPAKKDECRAEVWRRFEGRRVRSYGGVLMT